MATVVILGAGVGGLSVADELRNRLSDSDKVQLVDRSEEQRLGLSLLWVMRGWRGPDEIVVRPSVINRPGIEFLPEQVTSIDLTDRKVATTRRELAYDALVVALGSDRRTASVPGLTEALASDRGGEFYSLEGALEIRDKLLRFDGGRVVVVIPQLPFSCPAGPYEGALLMTDLLKERGLRNNLIVDVYTPEPLPMPVAGHKLGRKIVSLLEQYGIEFHPQLELESIDSQDRTLTFKDGRRVPYDFLAAIPAHFPPEAVARAKFSDAGWIPVQRRTLASPVEGVWALGDVTSLVLFNGRPLPKAAVFAQGQASAVADGVARFLGRGGEEPWFAGEGACWVEVGDHEAAYASGNFLSEPDPHVNSFPVSREFHRDKERQEQEWLGRWHQPAAR
jgi:sulfide:quinone oxidoreductase